MNFLKSNLIKILITFSFIPLIYNFYVIQFSAITFPFWDHAELINYIVKFRNETLNFFDLFSPHNHTRPFVYRLIYLINANLTDWDIRSEYIYMYMFIYGAFFAHIYLVKKNN